MNTQSSPEYHGIFSKIDKGMTYEDASRIVRISEDVLRIEHIEFAKKQPDYDKQIQRFTIKLIQDVGVPFIKALNMTTIESTPMPAEYEIETVDEFFESRADEVVPFKYRATVKALACKYVSQLSGQN